MPFRRRRRTRRRRRSRRFARRRPMRRRRAVLDPERKFLDVNVNQDVDWTGDAVFLNGSPQGLTQNDRQGLQQLNVSSRITYRIQAADNGAPQIMRVALVHYKQPNGANLATAVAFLWVQNGSIQAPLAPRDLFNRNLFSIIWQRNHRVDQGNFIIQRTVNKSFRIKTIYADDPSGTMGTVRTGGLWLVFISDTNTVANVPSIVAQSRTRFVG